MPIESREAFFIAEFGAAAALDGLLFVAISINLAKIFEFGGLADRALEALLLLAILVVSSLLLMPHQSSTAIGLEILGVGFATWGAGTALALRAIRQSEAAYRPVFLWNIIAFEIAMVPRLIGGLLVLAGWDAGLYRLAAGICLSFIKAVSDGWIFLVEINR